MKTKNIKINQLTDINAFVQEATKVNGDILVQRGQYIVDGKSLMGILSLDISLGCKVTYPKDAIDFETFISRFQM